MNIDVMERERLINEINTAFVRGYTYFERDILANQLGKMKVMAYEYTGYAARVCDVRSYFDENMKLLEDENLDALFLWKPDPHHRSATITRPGISTAQRQRTCWWPMAVSSRERWKTVFFSVA